MEPHYFTWEGKKYHTPGGAASTELYLWDGIKYVRTFDPVDYAAAQAWWETQLPLVTYNADGSASYGPGRGVLDPTRQSSNPSTLLILGAGLLFVILLARR